jgi:hypothetical protein
MFCPNSLGITLDFRRVHFKLLSIAGSFGETS